VNGQTDQLRALNMSKCRSAGDLIAELKAHSGQASLRKVGLRSTDSTPAKNSDDDDDDGGGGSGGLRRAEAVKNGDDKEPGSQAFKLVTLRHVNTALP